MRQEGNSGGEQGGTGGREGGAGGVVLGQREPTKNIQRCIHNDITTISHSRSHRGSPRPSFIGSRLAFQEPREAIAPLVSMPFLLQNTELVSRPTEKPG